MISNYLINTLNIKIINTMPKILRKTEFGNPILRNVCKKLTDQEIKSSVIKEFISNMYYTLENKKYGVGLAANQVGKNLAISVIDTKPTPTRPDIKRLKLTIINPEILEYSGDLIPMWEGCISGTNLYAQVPRYNKVLLKWQDENAKLHKKTFTGFIAQVLQHEVDHLNGIIFLDKVKDSKSFMTFSEYSKMRKKENKTK